MCLKVIVFTLILAVISLCVFPRWHFAPVPPRAEQEERKKMCLHYTTLAAVQYFSTNNLGVFKVLLWRWFIFLKLLSLPLSVFLSLFCFLRTNFFSHWTTCNADEAQQVPCSSFLVMHCWALGVLAFSADAVETQLRSGLEL